MQQQNKKRRMQPRQTLLVSFEQRTLVGQAEMQRFVRIQKCSGGRPKPRQKSGDQYHPCSQIEMARQPALDFALAICADYLRCSHRAALECPKPFYGQKRGKGVGESLVGGVLTLLSLSLYS